MSERARLKERAVQRRLASTSMVESLIAGHVASDNMSADLKELAELSLEVSLLRERLRYKASVLQVAFDTVSKQADHTWRLDVALKLEPNT